MKKVFINLIIIISISIILDLIFTFFFFSKLNFYEKINPKLEHRIANINYHHSFKKNVSTYDYWGKFKYKFITNSLGFKDNANKEISSVSNSKKRVIIIGDSFTEGIGYEYDDTFVGLLNNHKSNKNIEILNAGVASQSPIIYYKKIKHIIEEEQIKFNELIVFLDISDIPDEYHYNIDFDSSDEKHYNLRDHLQKFFIQNSSIYLFLDLMFNKLNQQKENYIIRYKTSKEFKIDIFKTTEQNINLYKSINVERGMWSHDINAWNSNGLKGRELADLYLTKLFELCKKNNIKFTLAIYPWPVHIYYDHNPSFHRNYWFDWAKNKNIKLIDFFKYFLSDDPEKIIEKFFIGGDIHWNKQGHYFINEIMMKEYFYVSSE